MILLPEVGLAEVSREGLRAFQCEVDAAGTYAERVAAGKRLFELRNRSGNAVFDEVKRALEQMCSGALRCAYCEDSRADEVEHVRPKDLYPEVVFAWSNYVYACGPCNGPKNNHFGVFVAGRSEIVDLVRKQHAPIIPPAAGDPAMIDPRVEDATKLMALDLRDTFLFNPIAARGTRDHDRADYTIRILRLNLRPELARARSEAYGDYLARLHQYQVEQDREARAPGSTRYEKASSSTGTLLCGARCSASATITSIFARCSRRSPRPQRGERFTTPVQKARLDSARLGGMTVRAKQGAASPAAAGGTERVTWPGKCSAAQVPGRNRAVGPGKRSLTQGAPRPVRRPPPK